MLLKKQNAQNLQHEDFNVVCSRQESIKVKVVQDTDSRENTCFILSRRSRDSILIEKLFCNDFLRIQFRWNSSYLSSAMMQLNVLMVSINSRIPIL